MCLYTTRRKKKAVTDIVCYKIMMINKRGELCSLYRNNFKWIIGKVYNAGRAWTGSLKLGEVKEGYFHSYMYNPAYYPNISLPSSLASGFDICIYECVIPAGAYYYEGIHTDKLRGYASKSLKIIKKIYYYE